MSIGEIITTPQGLAVVVQVLPTTIKLGSQVLDQVVAEPLTGGSPPPLPAGPTVPGTQPITPYQSIEAQAAAAYVATVVAQPPTTDTAGTTGGTSAAGAGGTGGTGTSAGATPVAYSSAVAQAYQATQDRGDQTGPQFVVIG